MVIAISNLVAQSDPYDFTSVNSYGDELNPVLSADGKTLYLTRSFHYENKGGIKDPGDIWVSQLDGNKWSIPENASNVINNTYHNGIFAIQNSTYYLYHHYMPGKQAAKTQGLSQSQRQGDGFSFPRKMDIKYFLNRSDQLSVSLSEDGSIIILSLDSYGSYGGEDLYVSFRQDDNSWSTPRNLGSGINTKYQEMTPYLLSDNKTLFFSTNGRGGFGGRDIFVTQRLDDTWLGWSEPVNLGSEVNSEGVELYFSFYPDNEVAIFTSTQNSEGYSDLKSIPFTLEQLNDVLETPIEAAPAMVSESDESIIYIEENTIPEGTLSLFGSIFNVNDSSSLNAELKFESNDESITVASNSQGYQIQLNSSSIYQVTVSADGFVGKTDVLDIRTSSTNNFKQDFYLSPIEVGTTVQLNNVLFTRGTTQLIESSYPELDLVVEMMVENEDLKIFLEGHTDNRGDAFANLKLSQDRVDTVIEYLVNQGVDNNRLDGEGYGGSRPIASNSNEETRRLNRRVEFTIVEN